MIEIKCTGSDELEIGEIKEFQGNLKERTNKDIQKIIHLIDVYGFSFPMFIWKKGKSNLCMDGHGRIKALQKILERDGKIPKIPVVYIQAKNEEEAKKKLLSANSNYGKMNKDRVLEFTNGLTIDFSEFNLSGGTLDMDKTTFDVKADVPFATYLGEENNYIVLKFDTDIDFINACTVFGIKQEKAFSTSKNKDNTDSFRKMGVGRVVEGSKAIEKIRESK